MMKVTATSSPPHPVSTPRAAAIAGILFALLFSAGMALVQLSVPTDPTDVTAFNAAALERITWSLRLMPFAGIMFLWFMGVMRDRLGTLEDQFFATVMLGSGLLFIAMTFVAFAIVGGMLIIREVTATTALTMENYLVDQSIIKQIFNVYALKMASVFMFSLSTLWRKTNVMPAALSILTVVLVIIMLFSLSLNPWMVMIFPAWVLIISLYLLAAGLKNKPAEDPATLSVGQAG